MTGPFLSHGHRGRILPRTRVVYPSGPVFPPVYGYPTPIPVPVPVPVVPSCWPNCGPVYTPPQPPMPAPTPQPAPPTQTPAGGRAAVRTTDGRAVRLRATPSLYGAEVAVYPDTSVVEILQVGVVRPSEETAGQTVEWQQVRVVSVAPNAAPDGRTGFMRASELVPIPNTAPVPSQTGYARMGQGRLRRSRSATVDVSTGEPGLNLRSAASMSSPIVALLANGTDITFIGRAPSAEPPPSEWAYVSTPRGYGFVRSRDPQGISTIAFQAQPAGPNAPPLPPGVAEAFAQEQRDFQIARDYPRTIRDALEGVLFDTPNGTQIAYLPMGTRYRGTSRSLPGDWYFIDALPFGQPMSGWLRIRP